ncbi:MAG: pyridoxamine 5'-phosphate oxidase family protein [Sulfurimicrobium sp.]|nr:pyridoxamine 5'-phosphate oxidase family protein [Sulfurimicrobium sp.]MDP2198709.1 pyridoxamine 5'-phosphate oxidase family protein [Sulfurimicrobium sp.]
MGKLYQEITPEIISWVKQQHLFFVSTAPLASDGHVNCSPKGLDTLRILGPRQIAYLDLTGSGAETIAHLRENGRIVFMFCALEGSPKIVRFHGKGEVVTPDSPVWSELRSFFPTYPGARAIIHAQITRVSDSCGYGVPKYEYVEERDTLERWAESKNVEGLSLYRGQKNARSIDDLPSLDPGNGKDT